MYKHKWNRIVEMYQQEMSYFSTLKVSSLPFEMCFLYEPGSQMDDGSIT